MKSLATKVQRFLVSEDGPTAVEYAVMLALIVIVCLDVHSFDWNECEHDIHGHCGCPDRGQLVGQSSVGQTLLAALKPTPLGSSLPRGFSYLFA